MAKKQSPEKIITDHLVVLRMDKLEERKRPPAAMPSQDMFQEEMQKHSYLLSWLLAHDLHIILKSHNIRMTEAQGGAFIGYSVRVEEIGDPNICGIQLSPIKTMINLHERLKKHSVVTAWFNGKSARVKY